MFKKTRMDVRVVSALILAFLLSCSGQQPRPDRLAEPQHRSPERSLAAVLSQSDRDLEGNAEDVAPPSGSDEAPAGALPKWAYDPGPDPKTPMGKELIDLAASIPDFPGISQAVMGEQKFRLNFGPIPWRMLQAPNSVKILFIGQDGTHIAEAAGRPATASFGGRAQDLAKYFGVNSSAAFINSYAFTIYGQYGAFNAPVIHQVPQGGLQVTYGSFVENPLWLISQDPDSPIVQWRNKLIEWIIRNNRDSLKLIVLFGGAARDSAATFLQSKGAQIGTRIRPEELATLQVPEMFLQTTNGNEVTCVPYTKEGGDLFEALLGRKPAYDDETKCQADIQAAQNALTTNIQTDADRWMNAMVFSKGGLSGSGVLDPAQLGGYDLAYRMEVNGQKTISLKGMKLADDLVIDHDILVAQLPHPSALSRVPREASEKVSRALKVFKPYVASGWKIEPDPGLTNSFAEGKPYKYGRAHMGPETYDFGAPASRMVDVSTASRMKRSRNVIIFGTRDKASFDMDRIARMTDATPSQLPDAREMWLTRPRLPESRYTFDPGPGEKYAKLMKANLPEELIRAHDVNGDFGHYRGTFAAPKVLILADPDGYDDLITARALTGSRGQYLHGLMKDMGIGDKYLVLKTAPFSLVETDLADWEDILSKTKAYREAVIQSVLSESKPSLILADGIYAAREIKRILGDRPPCPVIAIDRQAGNPASGILAAAEQIRKIPAFAGKTAAGKMADIPRSHLSFYARLWEGTSGDRVITSSDPKYAGKAFAVVAPKWAYSQKVQMAQWELDGVQKLLDKQTKAKIRRGGEDIKTFVSRPQ